MAEISPPEMRGSLLAMEQFSIVLGCVVGFWTGFLTRHGERLSPFFARAGSPSVELGWFPCYSGWEPILANSTRTTALTGDPSRFWGVRLACFSTSPGSSRPKRGSPCVSRQTASSFPFRSQDGPPDTGLYPPPPLFPLLSTISDTPKIELMEMEAEAIMLRKTSPVDKSRPFRNEALAWARLFDRRYIDRTLVGVTVMLFQRERRGTFA